MLQIVYQDEYFVAINKPHGLLVHKSPIATDVQEFAVQLLQEQLERKVFPIHRLDRKTSGILIFALSSAYAREMSTILVNDNTKKIYWAIVRGYFPDEIEVDYALTNDKGKVQEAVTSFKTFTRSELNIPLGKFETSRYSFIQASPKTGRMHQIRKHLSHLHHPIIGDRPHGCNKQNRMFKEKWNMMTMLLHAKEMHFTHPITEEPIILRAPLFSTFENMIKELKLTPVAIQNNFNAIL